MSGVFLTILGMGPGPLELGILTTFCPNWEFEKFAVLKLHHKK